MKLLKSEKGVSLIEVIAGMLLTAIVFAILSVVMLNFITLYQETKLYTQLQDDLYSAIEYMRYGYGKEYFTEGEGLIGLMTADSANVSLEGNSMVIYPEVVENLTFANSYWSKFSLNDNSQLEVSSQYGLKGRFDHEKIFPSTPLKKIGRVSQFKILNRGQIWSIAASTPAGKPLLMKITLEGQVRFRKRANDQTREDDKRKNVRTNKYETSVFLGNAAD